MGEPLQRNEVGTRRGYQAIRGEATRQAGAFGPPARVGGQDPCLLVQAQSVSRRRPFAADRGEVRPVEYLYYLQAGAIGLPAFILSLAALFRLSHHRVWRSPS